MADVSKRLVRARVDTLFSVVMMSVVVGLAGCGGDSSPFGDTCKDIGRGKCEGAVVKECRLDKERGYNEWREKKDCAKSSTPGCTCAVYMNLGICSTDGQQSGACG